MFRGGVSSHISIVRHSQLSENEKLYCSVLIIRHTVKCLFLYRSGAAGSLLLCCWSETGGWRRRPETEQSTSTRSPESGEYKIPSLTVEL